jgi:hypothetical protein
MGRSVGTYRNDGLFFLRGMRIGEFDISVGRLVLSRLGRRVMMPVVMPSVRSLSLDRVLR